MHVRWVHTQHTATHCNTLQHTATHCNTLQHTALIHMWYGSCIPNMTDLYATWLVYMWHDSFMRGKPSSWWCRASYTSLCSSWTYCNTLQHTATHCNTLHLFMMVSCFIYITLFFRFCETHFTTYQRFVANKSAISPFVKHDASIPLCGRHVK